MPRDVCFICGDVNENSHQRHHIVPKRFGGSDDEENLVTLCASCHQAIVKLYDRRFYEELGARKDGCLAVSNTDESCDLEGCTATADVTLPTDQYHDGPKMCAGHADCDIRGCDRTAQRAVFDHPEFDPDDGEGISVVCSEHRTCNKRGCLNRETYLVSLPVGYGTGPRRPFCETHAREKLEGRS